MDLKGFLDSHQPTVVLPQPRAEVTLLHAGVHGMLCAAWSQLALALSAQLDTRAAW